MIIGGPPGAGKTLLARGLADESVPGVHLEADLFFRFIVSGYIAPWHPESSAQNHVVNTAVARAAATYATSDYTVIVDGIHGPWFLDHLLESIDRSRCDVHYLIVSCDPDLAIDRIHNRSDRAEATRRYGADIDDEAIRFMHAQFRAADTTSFQTLDTSALSPEQALTQGRALLASGLLRLTGQG